MPRALLEPLKRLLDESLYEARVVGGAVRDRLIGREPNDFDVVVVGPALRLARALADRIGGFFYILDARREFGRVVWRSPEGRRFYVDLTRREGASWEEDLRRRDFTINAMMVDLDAFLGAGPFVPFDPLRGMEDLQAGRLRLCAPDAFHQDPVRILRAVRFEAEFGLRMTTETEQALQEALPGLARVAPERVREELVKILMIPPVVRSLRRMETLGILPEVLPEVANLRGVGQSPPHVWDVYEHTLRTVAAMERLLGSRMASPEWYDLPPRWAEIEAAMAPWWERFVARWEEEVAIDHPRRALLLLAALLHDIGKPATRTVEPDGRVRFISHERVGAEWAAHRLEALRFSNDEIEEVEVMVRHHMWPHGLARGRLTPRAIYRFFREVGERGVDLALLALADTLAVWGPTLTDAVWTPRLETARALWRAFFEAPERFVRPVPLVRGEDLLAMGVPEGPQIGRILEAIREAQAAGEITTREEALALARRLIDEAGAPEPRR
ncbi:CCA tRNA nucleotidyltransferase [Thermoflexus sp.]|uniref:CCA tRNA nucleotidyltransferase n=1 Tax=Thermoflexus sp. TaxID=1969742 RepID=UPI001764088F|nr:HD domain-containing protein [Thermoflexus sp.]